MQKVLKWLMWLHQKLFIDYKLTYLYGKCQRKVTLILSKAQYRVGIGLPEKFFAGKEAQDRMGPVLLHLTVFGCFWPYFTCSYNICQCKVP